MCFKLLLLNYTNKNTQLLVYTYFFFYNKINIFIKNKLLLNFFKIIWFKKNIPSPAIKIVHLKNESNKQFFFNLNHTKIFNLFLKIKYKNFYNFNKIVINKNFFIILNLHSYFYKYFIFLILNIKHILFFHFKHKNLFKNNKNFIFLNYCNNLNLSFNNSLRKNFIKNLLIFNKKI